MTSCSGATSSRQTMIGLASAEQRTTDTNADKKRTLSGSRQLSREPAQELLDKGALSKLILDREGPASFTSRQRMLSYKTASN